MIDQLVGIGLLSLRLYEVTLKRNSQYNHEVLKV